MLVASGLLVGDTSGLTVASGCSGKKPLGDSDGMLLGGADESGVVGARVGLDDGTSTLPPLAACQLPTIQPCYWQTEFQPAQ